MHYNEEKEIIYSKNVLKKHSAILNVDISSQANINWRTTEKKSISKELSFCHKIWFSYPYIFAFQCQRP